MNEYKLLLVPGDGRSAGESRSDHKMMRKKAR